jgi:hypothetical protein
MFRVELESGFVAITRTMRPGGQNKTGVTVLSETPNTIGAPTSGPARPRQRLRKAGAETSCVRQKCCFERNRVFSPSPPQKGGEGRGEEALLSISPLSDSLPARSSQGERDKTPQAVYVPNTTGRSSALHSTRVLILEQTGVMSVHEHGYRCDLQRAIQG